MRLADNLEMLKQIAKTFVSPEQLSPAWQLKLFSITQIPLLFLVQPKVEKLDDEGCEIRINLNYVTKNHLGSMYFGAQAIGADTVIGLPAFQYAKKYEGRNMSLIFKSMNCEFDKRAEGDLLFVCQAGAQIRAMVDKTFETGERVTEDVACEAALVESGEVVSRFVLGLSLKAR
jgi:hypothetical protein